MTRTRILIENACYHIYARGNQKQIVFIGKDDFEFYLRQLKHYKIKYSFHLYGYCLMPNHIHLMGKPTVPEKLSNFMQCLQRSYTAYYNKKYDKVGHLWQGKFKTKLITKDQYALDCISYIETNPVRAKLVKNPKDYIYCSYSERYFNNNDGLLNKFLL
jgi:REP element-mobilizing transposase RayT